MFTLENEQLSERKHRKKILASQLVSDGSEVMQEGSETRVVTPHAPTPSPCTPTLKSQPGRTH